MSHGSRRTLVALVTLFALSLPLAAQPHSASAGDLGRGLLAALWDRLTAPFSALWAADSETPSVPPPGTSDATPVPTPTPVPPEAEADGRSVIDPLG